MALSCPFPAPPVCTRFDDHVFLCLKWVCTIKAEEPGLLLNAFWAIAWEPVFNTGSATGLLQWSSLTKSYPFWICH